MSGIEVNVGDGPNEAAEENVQDLSVGTEDFEDDAPAEPMPESMPEEPVDMESNSNFEDEEQQETVTPRRQHSIHEPTYKEASPTVDAELALALPTLNLTDIVQLLESAAKISKSLSRDQAKSLSVHAESASLIADAEVYGRFFDSAEDLSNHLKSASGVVIGQTIPPYKVPEAGMVLSANEASAYLARLNKTFDYVYITAIHSGMWLKVQAPTGTDIHALLGEMATYRNQLGYETSGATLSCDSALRNMVFVNWLLDRTIQTNMKDSSQDAIRRNLVATDIPLLAQQLAATIHPSGYLTERACSARPGVCTHVEKSYLRLSKMIFTDRSRLTDKQLSHMQTLLRSGHRKTEDDMAAYRAEFGKTIVRQVTLSPMVKVTFTPPSLELYANTAEEWATEIKKASEDIVSAMTEMEARKHLQDQARLGVLTKYAAWVESIDLNGRMVQDQMAIRKTLATMSEDDTIVQRFTDGVSHYISDCTVAAAGVPDYECPACKGKQASGTHGITSSIAAIDPIMAFFTLAQLKIQRILLRDTVL